MSYIISGIQQMGIGVPDAEKGFEWYNKHFGMDIPVFRSAGRADLMQHYTGGRGWERYAILAINIQGGGGMEIWQHTERTPLAAGFQLQAGDLGINIAKIKCRDVQAFYKECLQNKLDVLSEPTTGPGGKPHFYMKDPYGNIFEITGSDSWFSHYKRLTGGISGAVMGVTHMENSMNFYSNLLGYDEVVYDKQGVFEDLKNLPGGQGKFRRALLRHSEQRKGAFSPLLGETEIELLQCLDRTPRKIYEGRFWGDLGYIHLCFDINGMESLQRACESSRHPFTVDSSKSFEMGEAAGHFAYIEDPDGALIEFVETHKVPVLKKLGWYLNLKKRPAEKPLPNWMLKAMALNRVKNPA